MTFVQFEADQGNIDAEVERLKNVAAQLQKDIADLTTVQLPAAQSKEGTNQRYYYKQESIVSSYNNELKQMLGGPNQTYPVTESDLTNLTGGRLWPPNAIELLRIPEFDGLGVSTYVSNYEKLMLQTYLPHELLLTNGLTTVTAISGSTLSVISAASTTIALGFDTTSLVNKQFIVHAPTAGQSFIGICTSSGDNSVTPKTSGYLTIGETYTIVSCNYPDTFASVGAPDDNVGTSFVASWTGDLLEMWTNGSSLSFLQTPTEWGVGFTFVTHITSNIPVGASFSGTWYGFTNAERTSQTSSIPFAGARQTVMMELITDLNAHITAQLVFQNAAKTALIGNGDPNIDQTALANINAAILYYTNYIATPNISDSGFVALNSFNTTRIAQIDARNISVISALKPFYEKRYFWAVQRSGSGGSLMQILRINMAITAAKTDLADAQHKLYTMGEHGVNVV